jgi:hypothetical protein
MGCERLGCPPAGMGTISWELRSKPAALFGHPAETNLGLALDAKNPYRYLQLKP